MSSNKAEIALERYAKACAERDEHIEANAAVFKTHEVIVGKIIDAENDLRDAVADLKASVSNGAIRVTYTPTTQVVYNEELVRALAPQAISTVERSPRITISRQTI